MNIPFDLRIAGIEDGILNELDTLKVGQENGYAKTVASYAGELDAEQLRRALGELTPKLPMFLVSYGDGKDTLNPATSSLPGEPRHYRHDCSFTVICCSGDARGDKARRRGVGDKVGVYKMIQDARWLLGGVRFFATIESQQVYLNAEPLRYGDVEYLARLPELTAYAVHFDTWFRFSEQDRTTPGTLVEELIVEVENTYPKGETNLPGVVKK
jgi:hypothetical protein